VACAAWYSVGDSTSPPLTVPVYSIATCSSASRSGCASVCSSATCSASVGSSPFPPPTSRPIATPIATPATNATAMAAQGRPPACR
jgi:hypothetical protein